MIPQLAFMLNGFYDFLPGATLTPFVGAGVGIALEDGTSQLSSPQFAYQAILGVAWNITPQVRLSLDTRYFGTTSPGAYTDNDITTMLSISYKFAPSAPTAAPPAAVPPPAPLQQPGLYWCRSHALWQVSWIITLMRRAVSFPYSRTG